MEEYTFRSHPRQMASRKLSNLVNRVRTAVSSDTDLDALARIHKTDKMDKHFYTPHYSSHFEIFRDKRINILEIGVGGHKMPFEGGKSGRMWRDYFPKGQVHSIDIYNKSPHREPRVKIHQGSQIDLEFLDRVVADIGEIDLIVDDGSHVTEHVLISFKHLFRALKKGGIYVVEDTQTSYWPDFGGDSVDLDNPKSSLPFFKGLTDGLNYEEYLRDDYDPTYFDRHITSMHFYHNMVFIYKGDNNEGSYDGINRKKSLLTRLLNRGGS